MLTWHNIERVFLIAVLLFCAGAFMPVLDGESQTESPQAERAATSTLQSRLQKSDPTKKNPFKLMIQIGLYGGVAVLLFLHRREVMQQLHRTYPLAALFAFAAISLMWSDLAPFAARRWLVLVASSACGLLLSALYSPRQLLRLLSVVILISAVLSIVWVVAFPSLGVDPLFDNGSWRGIFAQKNTLGRLMALGVIVQFFLMLEDPERRRRYAFGLVLVSIVLVMTRSVTAGIIAPALLALLPLFHWLRRRPLWVIATVGIIIALGATLTVVATGTVDHIFALIGRDSSLTGRVDLWEVVWPKMLEHPWLGYGYNSFWLGYESAQSADIWSIMKWNVPHSHNAFLDLVQELGLVGLGIFLWGFAIAVRRSITWLRWNPSILGLWPLTYLAFTLVSNMSEDAILKQDNMFWLLYVTTWLFLSATVPGLQQFAKVASVTPIKATPLEAALNLEGAR